MTKADSFFTITVSPFSDVKSCQEKLNQEAQGSLGFHQFTSCPNCILTDKGYQFWGENGYLQGTANDRASMIRWIAQKAKEQWKTKHNGIMGYHFRSGGRIFYRGN